MNAIKYRCWCPDMGHEADHPDDGEQIESMWGHADAGEKYVEKNFSDWSYPTDCDVMVRAEGETEAVAIHVSVESVPSFSASRKR